MSSYFNFLDYPVFITGHATSGTTLLRNILDGHPDLLVLPVESNFRAVIDHGGQFLDNFDFGRFMSSGPETGIYSLRHGKVSLASGDRDYSDLDFEEFKIHVSENWDGKSARSLQLSLIKSFYETSRYRNAKPKMWIEKTQGNEHYLGPFLKWHPNAKVIHMIRDPFDNFASYRKKMSKKGGIITAVSFCNEWIESLKCIQHLSRQGSENIFIIRFEDFLEKFEAIMQQICSFLQIADHASLRSPTTYGVPWSGNSQQNLVFAGITPEAIGSHKKSLEATEVDCVQYALSRYRAYFYWDYGRVNAENLLRISKRDLLMLTFIRFNMFKIMQKCYRAAKRPFRY